MALDEALLRAAAGRARPLLRVYSWNEPAVTFGYFQKFPGHLADKHTVIRRPTGGGIVYHTADTTYTVVVPPGHPLHKMPTQEAYNLLHRAIALALKSQLSNLKSTPRGEYECFQNPVAGDVVADDGAKLAGGAQRRGKSGMLHQGSIAAKVTVEQLTQGFQEVLDAGFQPYELTAEERALAEKLMREKYSTDAWNHRP
jgi:lipoate-protein ligase A